jgi:hypothetical protein
MFILATFDLEDSDQKSKFYEYYNSSWKVLDFDQLEEPECPDPIIPEAQSPTIKRQASITKQ